MTALVQAALRMRRTARSAWGLAAALLLAAFLLAGFFLPRSGALGWGHLAWAGAWLGLFGHRVRDAYRNGTDPRSAFELGVLLLVGVQALTQGRGGLGSDLHPLTYVAVALVASFATGWASLALVAFATVFGCAVPFLGEQVVDLPRLGSNALFIVCFGVLSQVFTRAEIIRVRHNAERELAAQRERMRDDTRLFRLVAPSSDGVRDEDRLHQT
ncbi:MAG: hypothetical protein WCE62_07805, partial [Polyangiales bacterium]